MVRVFCDRCGKEIVDGIQKVLQYFIPTKSGGRDGVHLCPECKKNLEDWFGDGHKGSV